MQAEANEQKNATNTPAAAPVQVDVNVKVEPRESWLKTFALVAVITIAILAGLGYYVFSLGDSNLPMNYPGFDGNKK